MKEFSKTYAAIAPSLTLEITAKAKQLRAQGENVIAFSAGEPDFNTPENIRNVAIARINAGGNGYTAASGMPDLKQAVCAKLKRDNGLDYEPSQIVISNGAKHALSNSLRALLNPGDEVILPTPYWVSYKELIKMCGGVPVLIEAAADAGFKVTADQIRAAATAKTKALILNSPNNPTGSVYTEKELKEIGKVATEKDFYIISDEIYEKLIYGEKHVSIASLSDDLYKRTVVVNGLSKAYAMTGWRIGYSACDARLAKIIGNIQSHATSNPNTIAQYAALEALNAPESEKAVGAMREAFLKRRDMMLEILDNIPRVSYVKPDGAFYVMVNVSDFYKKENEIDGSISFAARLLETEKVAVIPGIAFGVDDFIRLSYATSEDNIKNGLKRIKDFLATLK